MKSVAFLGTGKIALEYSAIIKKLGYFVEYASSSSDKSKSWRKFKSKNPNVKYLSTKEILNDKRINKIFALLPYLKQMEYFPKFLESKKSIFIEKPFSHNSQKFNRLLIKNKKNLKNKYISFNRRFYEVVNFLKKRLSKKDIKFVRVNINENFTQKTKTKSKNYKKLFPYFGSSSHIIDLLFYLFKEINFDKCFNSKKNYEYPSKYVLLRTYNNTPIFLFVEKDAPLKNGIEIVFKDNSLWSLSPIEKLQVYKGYKIKKNRGRQFKYLNYEQKLVFEKKERSNYKPGLEKTINFFLKKNKYNHNFMENLKYLKIYEKIFR